MLTVRDASLFAYDLRDAQDVVRASIRLPTRPAMARNAAFSLGKNGYVTIDADGTAFRVDYETFDDGGFGRLYRFFLMQGDTTVITATRQRGRPRTYRVDGSFGSVRLIRQPRLFGLSFDVIDDRGRTGTMRETTRFLAIRRRFEIDLPPSLDLPSQAFLFFLAANATYR